MRRDAGNVYTRRQMIARAANTLGGLAMAPTVTLADAFAEPNPSGRKTDCPSLPSKLPNAISTHFQKPGCFVSPRFAKAAPRTRRCRSGSRSHRNAWRLIHTQPMTWEARRIHCGSSVIVWMGKGPAFVGKAGITSAPAVSRRIVEEYPKRYLVARLGLDRLTQGMFDKGRILPIKITSVRDLSEGLTSSAGARAPSIDGGFQRPWPHT